MSFSSDSPLQKLHSRLLPADRHGRHLDIRRRIPEGVELFRIQEHDGAARAGAERSGLKDAVPAPHGRDVPPIKTAMRRRHCPVVLTMCEA
jgi:hypothetical protein